MEFYWGYRNHIINDTESEMPLCEVTLPANVRGTSVVIPQLEFVKEGLLLDPDAVIADSEYDSATIIEYIVKSLGARPRISINPRKGRLLPQDSPLQVYLYVLPALRCFPGVSGGIR